MNIRIFEDKEQLYASLSRYYIDKIKKQGNIILGMATGSTAIPLYKKLVDDHKRNGTSYVNVITFNLDEYIGLPTSHPESYFSFMHHHFIDHINIKRENFHIPNGQSNDLDEAIRIYHDKLNEYEIDIQLLGIGVNGHIGFNEPNTSFDSITHVVELSAKTRQDNARFFNSINQVPTHAITMGISDIMKAKQVVVVATGKHKADAVHGMIKGDINESLPASVLQKKTNVLVFLDRDAAAKL